MSYNKNNYVAKIAKENKPLFQTIKNKISEWFMNLKQKLATKRAQREAKRAQKKIPQETPDTPETPQTPVVEQKPPVVNSKQNDIDDFLKRISR